MKLEMAANGKVVVLQYYAKLSQQFFALLLHLP